MRLDAKTVLEITFGKNGIVVVVVVRANVYVRVCISKREDTVLLSRSRDRARPRTRGGRGDGDDARDHGRSIRSRPFTIIIIIIASPTEGLQTPFGSESHKKFKYFRRPSARAHASFLVVCNKNSVPFFEYKSSRQNVILKPLRFAAPFVILHVFRTTDTFYACGSHAFGTNRLNHLCNKINSKTYKLNIYKNILFLKKED